jgi:general secretion pathway protein H
VSWYAALIPGRAVLRSRGFTLLELMVAITIAGFVLAVSVPASARFYQSMQYRAAVKDVVTVLSSARYQAVNDGRAQDVMIDTRTNALRLNDTVINLPSELNIGVRSAGELNSDGLAVIRFYPEGGSSGGEVSVEMPQRAGVRVIVDWLIGGVSQEKYAIN